MVRRLYRTLSGRNRRRPKSRPAMPCVTERARGCINNTRMVTKPVEYGLPVTVSRGTAPWPLDDARPVGPPASAKLQVVFFDHADEGIRHCINLLVVQRRIDLERNLETILVELAEPKFLAKPLLHRSRLSVDERPGLALLQGADMFPGIIIVHYQ